MKLEIKYPNQKRIKNKWLILIHYPNAKHHLFFTYETETQLLKRIKSICFNARDKIAYLNAYICFKLRDKEEILRPYGEFTYRCKERM